MKRLLLSLAVLMAAMSASAEFFYADGIFYEVISHTDLTCKVAKDYSSYSGDVTIPSSVIYGGKTFSVTEIGGDAFKNCSNLTSVEIPNSVTAIGASAFSGCSNLKSMVIPNSVTTIGTYAFHDCTNLTSVQIGNSVTEIDGNTFFRCTSLASVVIGNSVTKIGYSAFSYCPSLTSVVIPNSVTEIKSQAFSYCTSLSSVEIGNSVTTIEEHAFERCSSLTSLVIPNSVTTIGQFAFCSCTSLTSVVIGNSVNSTLWGVFQVCSSLKSIVSLSTTPPPADMWCFDRVPTSTCVLKVPIGSIYAYKSASGWQDFQHIVGLTDEDIDALDIQNISQNPKLKTQNLYNMQGQPVGDEYKGIVIQGGKKYLKR